MNATSVAFAFADKLSRAGLMTQEDTDMLCSIRAAKATRGPMWTAKEDRQLLRMRTTASLPEVARRLGRSHESVRARLKRLRQSGQAPAATVLFRERPAPLPAEQFDPKPHAPQYVPKKDGRSSRLSQRAASRGNMLRLRKKRWAERNAIVWGWHEKGLNKTEIAVVTGLCRRTVASHLKERADG